MRSRGLISAAASSWTVRSGLTQGVHHEYRLAQMATKRRAKAPDEKPDPIRRKAAKLVDVIEEPSEAALAKPVAREAATGAPPAGRTTLEDARARGPLPLRAVVQNAQQRLGEDDSSPDTCVQHDKEPLTHVTHSPPTPTCPSASTVTKTRPSRPTHRPCVAM
jgi:hypothetical protein